MTNLERLKKTLAQEAAEQAAAILAEAEERAAALRRQAAEEVARLRAAAEEACQRELAVRQRQAEAEERLWRRQAVLSVKGELVQAVLAEAQRRMVELPADEYQRLLGRLLAESAPVGEVQVIFNRRDQERLGTAFLRQAAETLRSQGREVRFTLAPEPGEFVGGFKLRGQDYEVDCTFERLLARAADALEPEIAGVLFGQQEV